MHPTHRRVLSSVAIAAALLPRLALAQADHLECYKIKDSAPKAAYVADLAGLTIEPGCKLKVPAKLLCVDTTKTNVQPPPPGSAPGAPTGRFACYKVKCPKTAHALDTLSDQFGTRQVQPKTSSLLCAPAQFGAPTTTTTSTTLPPQVACNDNVDQDGDGAAGYPNDPGCASPLDIDETDDCPSGPNCPMCGNGLDDEGDSLTDYPADPDCTAASDPSEFIPQCDNNVDDDGDGKSDYPDDPGCTSVLDSNETDSCPAICPACADTIDNDIDTFIDYPADTGCTSASDATE